MMLESISTEAWARRNSFDEEMADIVWRAATTIVEKMQLSGMPPALALHACMLACCVVGASCRQRRETIEEILRDNLPLLWSMAEELASRCPVVERDESGQVDSVIEVVQ